MLLLRFESRHHKHRRAFLSCHRLPAALGFYAHRFGLRLEHAQGPTGRRAMSAEIRVAIVEARLDHRVERTQLGFSQEGVKHGRL